MNADITIRPPLDTDGPAAHRLVADCPPLEPNSLYCNVLQCAHFADTCAIAERGDGKVVGFLSGYRMQDRPDTLFVWQVAVHGSQRGQGLAKRMIMDVLARPESRGIRRVTATIAEDNAPSWALFKSLAKCLDCGYESREAFRSAEHFAGAHATESLIEIGPFVPHQPTVDA